MIDRDLGLGLGLGRDRLFGGISVLGRDNSNLGREPRHYKILKITKSSNASLCDNVSTSSMILLHSSQSSQATWSAITSSIALMTSLARGSHTQVPRSTNTEAETLNMLNVNCLGNFGTRLYIQTVTILIISRV